MVKISNSLIGIINVITLVVSIGIIATGLYFRLHGHTDCQKFLEDPILILGAFLFVVSLIGLIGSCGYVTVLLCIYLVFLTVLIVGLICFTVFAFVVTNKGVGQVVSGRGFKEYRLGDYSNWLKNHMVNGKNWGKIKSCLIDIEVCKNLGKNEKAAEFYKNALTATQSGCCKPPVYCGFTFKNATLWEMPITGPAVGDIDCRTWSNQQDKLCYDCESCKAGMLDNLKKDWKKFAILNIALIVFLFVVNSIASCAYINSRYDRYKGYRGYYH